MSRVPKCPTCEKPTDWTPDGSKPMLCKQCLAELVAMRTDKAVHDSVRWLKGREQPYVGVFNIMAIGAFIHGTQAKLNFPDWLTVKESWEMFKKYSEEECYSPNASRLYEMLMTGLFPAANARNTADLIQTIHDMAFHGQTLVNVKINGDVIGTTHIEEIAITK